MNRRQIIEAYLESQPVFTKAKPKLIESLDRGTRLSVVVPAYNERETLPNLLNSLDGQTCRQFEVVVVDNGSTDGTGVVANTFARRAAYPLFAISEETPGVGNARKRGMDEVLRRVHVRDNGDCAQHIIVLTDADVTAPSNWLQKIAEIFNAISSGALAGSHGARMEIDQKIYQRLGIRDYFNLIPELIEQWAASGDSEIKMSGPNSAYEIEAYAAGGGMDQPLDILDGQVVVKGSSLLGWRIKELGYPLLPMGVRVVSSRRRHLLELLGQRDSYITPDCPGGERISAVRTSEDELLEQALRRVSRERWVTYREQTIRNVKRQRSYRL